MKENVDENKGYIVEVDIDYPQELHDKHNCFPLAPERLEMGGKEKLVPNLNNKEKYMVHLKTLQLYISLGLKVTKIHRALSFTQDTWMCPDLPGTRCASHKQTNFLAVAGQCVQ